MALFSVGLLICWLFQTGLADTDENILLIVKELQEQGQYSIPSIFYHIPHFSCHTLTGERS